MKKLLHIIATPKGDESRTLKVSSVFLEEFKKKFTDCEIDEINLFEEKLPNITVKLVKGKFVLMAGNALSGDVKDSWSIIEPYIKRFLSADFYLISTPMWNFSIPYVLKQYIDIIVQPQYLFRYTATGPEGLAKNKKMLVITSRGGDYSKDSPAKAFDQQEPYLRTVFGFTGITDLNFIYAQPMDALGPEIANQKISQAQEEAKKFVEKM